MPVSRTSRAASSAASEYPSPWRTIEAPCALTALTLISGVVSGMTIVAFTPRRFADRATPCAWLPAEAASTPFASAAAGRRLILLYAPRILKLFTG